MAYTPRMESLVNTLGIPHFLQEFYLDHYSIEGPEGDSYAIGMTVRDDPFIEGGDLHMMSWSFELIFSLNAQNRLDTTLVFKQWVNGEKRETHTIAHNSANVEAISTAFSHVAIFVVGLPPKRAREYEIGELRRMCDLIRMVLNSPIYDLPLP